MPGETSWGRGEDGKRRFYLRGDGGDEEAEGTVVGSAGRRDGGQVPNGSAPDRPPPSPPQSVSGAEGAGSRGVRGVHRPSGGRGVRGARNRPHPHPSARTGVLEGPETVGERGRVTRVTDSTRLCRKRLHQGHRTRDTDVLPHWSSP